MKDEWEKKLKKAIEYQVSAVSFSEEDSRRILEKVHDNVGERKKMMNGSKKRIVIAAAAMVAAAGSITAIGAGRIAFLSSSTYRDQAIRDFDQLKAEGEKALGQIPKLKESLGGGQTFSEGYVSQVNAMDDSGNLVGTYPEVSIIYDGTAEINMSVSKPLEGAENGVQAHQVTETYQGIVLEGDEVDYLFLPPDATPSAEDQKLEEEGKLMISYGTDQEERKVFKNVSWEEDGLHYLLLTDQDVTLSQLMDMAGEIIDVQ
ncbi:MAG TPA: hypothetical protein IAA51_01285 [Candidatus Cottocaccamicrobium excrementipullorum]|nr:hypothetical protein [Candidatus Cottocaccamicrobium excrementipullorum]